MLFAILVSFAVAGPVENQANSLPACYAKLCAGSQENCNKSTTKWDYDGSDGEGVLLLAGQTISRGGQMKQVRNKTVRVGGETFTRIATDAKNPCGMPMVFVKLVHGSTYCPNCTDGKLYFFDFKNKTTPSADNTMIYKYRNDIDSRYKRRVRSNDQEMRAVPLQWGQENLNVSCSLKDEAFSAGSIMNPASIYLGPDTKKVQSIEATLSPATDAQTREFVGEFKNVAGKVLAENLRWAKQINQELGDELIDCEDFESVYTAEMHDQLKKRKAERLERRLIDSSTGKRTQ